MSLWWLLEATAVVGWRGEAHQAWGLRNGAKRREGYNISRREKREWKGKQNRRKGKGRKVRGFLLT